MSDIGTTTLSVHHTTTYQYAWPVELRSSVPW
jgi:hypothetical protein